MRVLFFIMVISLMPLQALANDSFDTFMVIVGIEKYEHIEGLEVLGGAEADCRELAMSVVTAGLKEEHVLSFCGEEMGRDRFISSTQRLYEKMKSGDKLVFVWTGHGIREDNFSYFLPASAFDEGVGGSSGKIGPDTIMLQVRLYAPGDTQTLWLIETAHKGKIGETSLIGPILEDFNNIEDVLVMTGHNVPEKPIMTEMVSECWTKDQVPTGVLTYGNLSSCLARGLGGRVKTSPHQNIGDIPFWYTSGRVSDEDRKKPLPAGFAMMTIGGGFLLASGVTFGITSGMRADVFSENPEDIFATKEDYYARQGDYQALNLATLGLFSAGVVLAGSGAVYFAISPKSVSISGRW